jgi:hypothetical protein
MADLPWVRVILGTVFSIWCVFFSAIPWLAAGTIATFFLPDAVGGLIFLAMMIYAFWTGHVWVGTAIAAYGISPYLIVLPDLLVKWLYHWWEDRKENARPIDVLIRPFESERTPPPPLPTEPWLREMPGPRFHWYVEGLTSAGKHFVNQHAPKQPLLYLNDFNEGAENSKLKCEFAPCVWRSRPL